MVSIMQQHLYFSRKTQTWTRPSSAGQVCKMCIQHPTSADKSEETSWFFEIWTFECMEHAPTHISRCLWSVNTTCSSSDTCLNDELVYMLRYYDIWPYGSYHHRVVYVLATGAFFFLNKTHTHTHTPGFLEHGCCGFCINVSMLWSPGKCSKDCPSAQISMPARRPSELCAKRRAALPHRFFF